MLPIVVVMTIKRIDDDDDDGCNDDQKFMTAPCPARASAASKSPSPSETERRGPVARCSLIRRDNPKPQPLKLLDLVTPTLNPVEGCWLEHWALGFTLEV